MAQERQRMGTGTTTTKEDEMSKEHAKPFEVELDFRRRLPLARLKNTREHDRFEVAQLVDGCVILTPMASITKRELELLSNQERARDE